MGQKLRKMVMQRAALCDLVVGAIQVQGPEIGAGLGSFLRPALGDGEELPDPGFTIQLYGRRLQAFCDAMVQADAEYLTQRALLSDLYRESEDATTQVKKTILSLRSTCEGLLGTESLRSLGLDFNVAQELKGVLRQGEIIRDRLRGAEGELKPSRWVKAPLTRAEVADELDGEIEGARVMDQRLVAQRKVVDTAKVRKDQTRKEFDGQFIPIARMLEATFRIAGETELADRIRPTVRQLDRAGSQEEETAESGTNSQAEASDAPPAPDAEPVAEPANPAS